MVSRVITYCTCITALTSGAFYDSLGVESTQNSGTVKFLAEFYGHPRFNSKSTEKLQYLGLRRCKIPVMLQIEKNPVIFFKTALIFFLGVRIIRWKIKAAEFICFPLIN